MKSYNLIKYILLGIFLPLIINGCSVNEDAESRRSTDKENLILFSKSPLFNWGTKKVEVSFEDDFQKFESIDSVSISGTRFGYSLSDNNLEQGFAIRLKVIDPITKSQQIDEIMIESFQLKSGLNQLVLGYNNSKPYIIY